MAEAADQRPSEEGAMRATEGADWESFYRNYRKPGYIPGFEIGHKLGGGVFGIVYKARKESIGKPYAIKFLRIDDPGSRLQILKELEQVRLFAQVDHPNLVSIEDQGVVDGIPFITMGFAGEETLKDRLEDGGLSEEDALRYFVQIARGVRALHEHSLVHFDLKPANIFVKGDIARVGDYGLSKLMTESAMSLTAGRGTPYYMAPEQLLRRGDARSDIYSLGVILYECLTGSVPFQGENEWEVLKGHEEKPVPYPPTMRPALRTLLARMLAKDPELRVSSVAEVLESLQSSTRGLTDLAGSHSEFPATPKKRPPTPVRAKQRAASPPARDRRRGAGGPGRIHRGWAELDTDSLSRPVSRPISGLWWVVGGLFALAILLKVGRSGVGARSTLSLSAVLGLVFVVTALAAAFAGRRSKSRERRRHVHGGRRFLLIVIAGALAAATALGSYFLAVSDSLHRQRREFESNRRSAISAAPKPLAVASATAEEETVILLDSKSLRELLAAIPAFVDAGSLQREIQTVVRAMPRSVGTRHFQLQKYLLALQARLVELGSRLEEAAPRRAGNGTRKWD